MTATDVAAWLDVLSASAGATSSPASVELARAWTATVADFRRLATSRPALYQVLRELSGLSPAGFDAAFTTMLDGVDGPAALDIFETAKTPQARLDPQAPPPVWVVLASNLPALAVQPLLCALAAGRPVLIKSASDEPLFAPAFVDSLCQHAPALRDRLIAATWTGGDQAIESAVLDRVSRVVAYGGGETLASLRRRVAQRPAVELVAHGPKISLGLVDHETIGRSNSLCLATDALARDIALFDQRGCLSIQAIYTDGDVDLLATSLADALERLAPTWPMGPSAGRGSIVRQVRDAALMAGARVLPTAFEHGTVLVEPGLELRPSPGHRVVRVHCLDALEQLAPHLESWRGGLQGVAAAGSRALDVARDLTALGVSRVAPAGALQSPDVSTWRNGGLAPLAAFL